MLFVNVDVSDIKGLGKELEDALKSETAIASQELAMLTQAKAIEMANERLHSRRQKFIEALHVAQDGDVWTLTLDASARWIDDGLPEHNMLDDLLSSPNAKRAADGSRYVVIPFAHGPGKGSGNDTPEHQDLVNTLKTEMKRGVFDTLSKDPGKRTKIPWAKIEKNEAGQPKLGRLHSFTIDHAPLKTHDGPQQGRGPVGDVRQGPNKRQIVGGGPGGGGTPFLAGVSVYQKKDEKTGSVQRSVMTFRIASSKHQGQDRWNHPGLEPKNIFEDAWKWAQDAMDREIVPKLVAAILAKL